MAVLADIKTVKGDSFDIQFVVLDCNGNPMDITEYFIRFEVEARDESIYTISNELGPNPQIVLTSPATGEGIIHLRSTDTQAIQYSGIYYIRAILKTSAEEIMTVIQGRFKFVEPF